MRSSDWSADVCSSDLAGLRYTNETKRNDPDNFYIDNGFGLPPFAVNNPNPDPATIIDNPAKVKLKNVSPMVSLDHRWSPSIMTRSEEHTSELQSLMRISYAVFCLKKKKN